MATTFTGFSHPHKNALQADFREAQRLSMRAANSLLLTQGETSTAEVANCCS
jgi:hypothetical protein